MTESNIELTNKIVELFAQNRIVADEDRFYSTGRESLSLQVAYFVDKNQPLQMILPGFPCKSPDKNGKSFGRLPDLGEAMAILHLDDFCLAIGRIYSPGA